MGVVHGGGAPTRGSLPLSEEAEARATSPPQEDVTRRRLSAPQEEGPPETGPAATLTVDSQTPELRADTLQLLKPQVSGPLPEWPELTKPGPPVCSRLKSPPRAFLLEGELAQGRAGSPPPGLQHAAPGLAASIRR